LLPPQSNLPVLHRQEHLQQAQGKKQLFEGRPSLSELKEISAAHSQTKQGQQSQVNMTLSQLSSARLCSRQVVAAAPCALSWCWGSFATTKCALRD
jgi:hypothetical protein